MGGTLSTSIWMTLLLTTMMMLLSCVMLSIELHVNAITATGRMTGAEPECSHQVPFFVALAERVEPRDPPQVSDSQAKSSCRVLVRPPGIETATTADNRGISSESVRLPEARPSQPLHQQLSQQAVANEVEYLEKMSGDVDDLCEIGQNIEFNESVHDQYEYEQNESKIVSVKSRLRDHVEFWKSNLFANEFILNTLQFGYIIKVCRQSRKTFLFLFCFLLLRSARLRRQTFMFLFCLLCIIKVCPTSSADLYVFVLSFVYY